MNGAGVANATSSLLMFLSVTWISHSVTSINDAKEYGGSLGGVCGFGWRFQDRIAIYTEAILNAQYTRTDRTFNVNGATTTLENKNNFAIVPMVPIALFLTIKF